MSAEVNAFQAGADFISFNTSPPPPQTNGNAQAGPSRHSDQEHTNGKRKIRPRDGQDSEDERLVEAGTGLKEMNADGKKRGWRKDHRKHPRPNEKVIDSIGPRNLKEERIAAERHAPWADLVDWKRCHDPAEMHVVLIEDLVVANPHGVQVE